MTQMGVVIVVLTLIVGHPKIVIERYWHERKHAFNVLGALGKENVNPPVFWWERNG